jgi:hypothetical protein
MNYSDAPAGFQPLDTFSDAPPGFKVFRPESKSVGGFLDNAGTDAADVASKTYQAVTENPKEAASATADYLLNPVTYLKSVGDSVSNLWEGGLDRAYKQPVKTFLDATNVLPPVPIGAVKGVTAVAKGLPKKNVTPRAAVRDGAELIKTGGERRIDAKKSDAAIPVETLRRGLFDFHGRMADQALRINPKLHPKAAAAMQDVLKYVNGPKVDPMLSRMPGYKASQPPKATLQALHEARQLAQEAADDVHPGTRRPTADAKIGVELIRTIDDMIKSEPEFEPFIRGTNELARGLRDREISDALDMAMQTATWQRGDKATAIRNAMRPLYKKYRHRWPKEDLDVLRQAQHFGLFIDTLAGFANKGPGAQTFARGAELAVGLPPFAMWPMAKVAKEARNRRVEGLVDKLREKIRAGGPVGK